MPTVCTLLVPMKSNNNNNNDDDDDDDNNNMAMGSVHARGDTFLTFGLKALTETNTSRLTTDIYIYISISSLYSFEQVNYLQTLLRLCSSSSLRLSFLVVLFC
jgi:hypothetical protein